MPSGAKQYTFLSIGECMVELSGGTEGLFRMGFAGDTLNTAWYARAHLSDDWDVAYFTAIGDDRYSKAMSAFLDGNGISTRLIQTIPGKRPGLPHKRPPPRDRGGRRNAPHPPGTHRPGEGGGWRPFTPPVGGRGSPATGPAGAEKRTTPVAAGRR